MDKEKSFVFAMYMDKMQKDYRDAYSRIFALNLTMRDVLMTEFGMSKNDAEQLTVEFNERERKIVQKAAELAESGGRG